MTSKGQYLTDHLYLAYDHRPPHYFQSNAKYMLTASTWRKDVLLGGDEKKAFFIPALWKRAEVHGWPLESWAVLPNHYHFVAEAPEDASTLRDLIREVHSITAKEVNKLDGSPGRKVWYNYWDTCITDEGAYLARLHYVNVNPVKHNLVTKPEDYEFCSYRWFTERSDPSFLERVFSQPIDRVQVHDDY